MTTRDVLRDADFRRLWVGTTASRLGTSVSSVATPLVALEVLDASALVVSLLTAALWSPWLLVGLPAGALVDRLPGRAVMLVSDAVALVALASVPAAAWAGRLTEAHLLGANLVLGTCSVFFTTAWVRYLPALVGPERVVPANAVLHGSESAAQVAGPGVAGVLAGALGAVAGLAVDALTYLVSAWCLLTVRRRPRQEPAAARRPLHVEIAEGVRVVARDRYLRCLVLHGAASNLPLAGYQAVLVVFLVRDVGLSAASVGLLLALTGLGGVLGASCVQQLTRRLGSARTLVLCKAGAGPCALLVPLTGDGWRVVLLVVGTTLVVAGVVAGNVVSSSFRQAYVPADLLGRVTTSMQLVNLGTIPLGAVVAGVLASATSLRTAVAVLTAAYALSGLVLVLGPLRGRRDLPGPPTAPADVPGGAAGRLVRPRPRGEPLCST